MEVLVALLIMGFVSAGLMNLLFWGRLRYNSIDEGWRERDILKSLHKKLRTHISVGNLEGVKDLELHFNERFSTSLPMVCTSLNMNSYASDTVFVKPSLFIDRNRNGRADPSEKLPSFVWCFRIRSRP